MYIVFYKTHFISRSLQKRDLEHSFFAEINLFLKTPRRKMFNTSENPTCLASCDNCFIRNGLPMSSPGGPVIGRDDGKQ